MQGKPTGTKMFPECLTFAANDLPQPKYTNPLNLNFHLSNFCLCTHHTLWKILNANTEGQIAG